MISFLAGVLVAATAAASIGAPPSAPPAITRTITTSPEGFTAAFPRPPLVVGHAPESDSDSGYWIYADRSGCASVNVRVDEYPKSIRPPAPNPRAYDLILRAHALETSTHLRSEQAVTLDGALGLEGDFVGAVAGGEHLRVVMVGRRVYQVSYIGAAGDECRAGDAFLASFRFDAR